MYRVRGQAFLFVVLLLAGVALFLYSISNANVVRGEALLLPTGAAVLVLASAIVAVTAVSVWSRFMDDKGKRRVRMWSVWYVALALALLVVSLGFGAISATPACQQFSDACAFVYGFQLLGLWAAGGIPLLVTYVGAAIVGLSSAAKAGQRGWFESLLVYLIVSALIVVVAVVVLAQNRITDPTIGVIVGILVFVSLLFPVVTLIYSFSG